MKTSVCAKCKRLAGNHKNELTSGDTRSQRHRGLFSENNERVNSSKDVVILKHILLITELQNTKSKSRQSFGKNR